MIILHDASVLFSGEEVHEEIGLFNKTLINIFHNFTANKAIVCDNKDPPWMNDKIKILIKKKNWLFQRETKFGKFDCATLNYIVQNITNAFNSSELKYHERLALKLNDPKTSQKPTGKYYTNLLMEPNFLQYLHS